MALALGAILLTPFIGYTTYREFVTYTKVDGEWHASLPIAATFDPNFTDYGTPYVPVDDLKLPDTNPANGRRVEYINFDALSAPKVISIAGYDKYIENIELIVYERDLKEYEVESANFDSISFKFLNKGLDLEVSLPNGVTEVHHIYDKFLTVDKTAIDPVIIEGTGYKLLITSYFINQFDTRNLNLMYFIIKHIIQYSNNDNIIYNMTKAVPLPGYCFLFSDLTWLEYVGQSLGPL